MCAVPACQHVNSRPPQQTAWSSHVHCSLAAPLLLPLPPCCTADMTAAIDKKYEEGILASIPLGACMHV
jgi:hypothetical protein